MNVLKRAARSESNSPTVKINVHVKGTAHTIRGRIPHGEDGTIGLLPILRNLDDVIVSEAERAIQFQGKQISCRAGCGACCRQLVPVSPAEAMDLVRQVRAMAPSRRECVVRRFEEAVRTLERVGLLERLLTIDSWSNEESIAAANDYFHLGIPCPFLVDESCSIYQHRPMSCREYLVTSPSAHCANPADETIERVPLPLTISRELFCFDSYDESRPTRIPLVLILRWIGQQSERIWPSGEYLSLLEGFIERLQKQADDRIVEGQATSDDK